MSYLISRTKVLECIGNAINEIVNLPTTHDNARKTHECDNEHTETHAEPERHGRWEFIGDQMFRCSECGHTFTQKFLEGWRESVHEPLFTPHCPSCGSYNRGDSE